MCNWSAWKRLFRIEHAFLLVIAVLLGELIASKELPAPMPSLPIVLLSLAVPFFIEMGSFALNDYWDVKTDRENGRKDRPLVSGEIEPKRALLAAIACYVIGVGAALPLPPIALYIAALFALLSVFYNHMLKDLPFIGNKYIALSMAIPFVFGNLVVSSALYPPLVAIAAVAFVSGLGREIIKSAEDVEGDMKHRKSKTLPAIIGKKKACQLAAGCYFALVPLSLLPFALGLSANLLAVGLVALTAVSFAAMGFSVMKNQSKENLEASRRTSLLTVAVGLAGYAASLI
ncbi:MAG: UbiA family prenyltransferase [Candidatus Anstonellaceae archaeon]